jgi:hypothetical protein
MTAAQKRAPAKTDYDAFLAGCPSRQLLDRISDKWVALILAALGNHSLAPWLVRRHCPPWTHRRARVEMRRNRLARSIGAARTIRCTNAFRADIRVRRSARVEQIPLAGVAVARTARESPCAAICSVAEMKGIVGSAYGVRPIKFGLFRGDEVDQLAVFFGASRQPTV